MPGRCGVELRDRRSSRIMAASCCFEQGVAPTFEALLCVCTPLRRRSVCLRPVDKSPASALCSRNGSHPFSSHGIPARLLSLPDHMSRQPMAELELFRSPHGRSALMRTRFPPLPDVPVIAVRLAWLAAGLPDWFWLFPNSLNPVSLYKMCLRSGLDHQP